MANYENIKDKGFDKRTTSELREISSRGGKRSGEVRRLKADFRRTLNLLLTAKTDNPEWTPMLEALGLDSTLESAVNAAMIKEALAGNVKAYEAIARFSGQTEKAEADIRNKDADTELKQARKQAVTGENETDDLASSSKRYKNHVRNADAKDVSGLLQVPVVYFDYKPGYLEKDDDKPVIGFYAENMEKHFPEAVRYNSDGTAEDWNYRTLIPGMMKLIQEQKKQLDSQEKRIANLEKLMGGEKSGNQ